MTNFRIYLPLVNGSEFPLHYESGLELIDGIIGDDLRPPPCSLQIEAITTDDKRIRIGIPYDERKEAFVCIEDT